MVAVSHASTVVRKVGRGGLVVAVMDGGVVGCFGEWDLKPPRPMRIRATTLAVCSTSKGGLSSRLDKFIPRGMQKPAET
ncbi:hypothetical protein V6N12_014210 [Hibiscus sabdariffa]|uniref:Uncharacterized protein n=1 Tax=Hibiscus sabdariffa TaxID=183260 RepID=A0ABR2DKF5_9ROSI